MARNTQIIVTDDLGGKGAASPIRFSIDGKRYSIDLNKRNMDTFLRRFQPYIDAATEVPPGHPAHLRVAADGEGARMRAWAAQNGFKVSGRGRLSREVHAAYHAAQNAKTDDA